MNNLIFLFDSLSVVKIGCYGAKGKTSSVDALAANGDLFTFCYADLAGQGLRDLIDDYPTHVFDDVYEFLRFDLLGSFLGTNSQTQVLRFSNHFDADSADQVVASTLMHLDTAEKFECNVVFTSLQGLLRQNETGDCLNALGELATHVPFIVSIAKQDFSRRRSTLLSTPQMMQLIESLIRSNEEYDQLRDSIVCDQLQYRTENATATRTTDWLLIREEQLDEHGEHVQMLFRKPEDVWEILNVADQYPQVIEHFSATGQLTFPDAS